MLVYLRLYMLQAIIVFHSKTEFIEYVFYQNENKPILYMNLSIQQTKKLDQEKKISIFKNIDVICKFQLLWLHQPLHLAVLPILDLM